jgi:hypothetical protein
VTFSLTAGRIGGRRGNSHDHSFLNRRRASLLALGLITLRR